MSFSTQSYSNVFTEEEINYILSLPEVINAKSNIDSKATGQIYFSIHLTTEMKQSLYDNVGLNLFTLESIPMRWIKGDTLPHIDSGAHSFDNTYLMYLTDSSGQLVVDGESYPITKGSAYVFNEGLDHETIDTGFEPRLLLGPMSEEGFAVGAAPNQYIREVEGVIQYSYNKEDWDPIITWPHNIYSITLEFVTDITLTSADQYFIVDTNVTIGTTQLNDDGTRRKIYIDGVENYPGLIQNGIDEVNGYNNVNVFNLEVLATNGSTLYASEGPGSGWIGQQYFGKGATDNYIVNCSSDGPINSLCGGIVGPYSGSQLTIIGCSSSGRISFWGGGIAGYMCGSNGGSIFIRSSYSTGEIADVQSGGIIGNSAGANGGLVNVTYCYSEGAITGTGSGGIIGGNAGDDGDGAGNITINGCYSRGNMSGSECGGIMGSYWKGLILINNCYSTGNVTVIDDIGAIAGPGESTNSFQISYCYASGSTVDELGYMIGSQSNVSSNIGGWILENNYSEAANSSSGWNSTNANTVLQELPDPVIGDVWISPGTELPYELYLMGYSPYTKENIYFMGIEPTLNNIYPPVGNDPKKDMANGNYTDEFDPNNYQGDFFGDMADFIDENIVVGDKVEGDRLNASYWNDLGNDIFNGWGYFYLYDVTSGRYYFPLLNPQNQDNGVITTQTFNAFDRTFTIKHGWSIRGVFKIDITVNDVLPFRFGSYGIMGSDGDQELNNLNYDYTIDGQTKKLYYHCDREANDEKEILYSYFIPKSEDENYPYPYEVNYNDDNMSMKTIQLTQGVTIYFSKSKDVREFVVNELKVAAGESSKTYVLSAGQSGDSALISGKSYTILRKGKFYYDEENNQFIYESVDLTDNTITIDSNTGVISTNSSTPNGHYEIVIRNTGSYHITTYVLIVGSATNNMTQYKYYLYNDLRRVHIYKHNRELDNYNKQRCDYSFIKLNTGIFDSFII